MGHAALNTLALAAILLLSVCYLLIKLSRSRHSPAESSQGDKYSLDSIIAYIKFSMHEISRNQQQDYGLSEEAYKRRRHQRAELRKALKGCVTGDEQDKRFVKSYISNLLQTDYGLGAEHVDFVIPFEEGNLLTVQDRFELILYIYKLRYGHAALAALITDYNWDHPKEMAGESTGWRYEITREDVDRAFYLEYRKLTYEEKLEFVAQRVYQQYKGLSVIDEIRDQNIDGVSGGVSGIPQEISLDHSLQDFTGKRSWDSIWIFFKGKSIHLSFLSFGSEGELKRVCQNIYKYNLPGPLSEANGFKVNEMKDGSRVVVVRPPFAESWAFFVRKFDASKTALEELIVGENAEMVVELLTYLMKGSRITAITGAQGSGKTTLLMALVKYIYQAYTLRVQEMSFELHLRRLYPTRNILTFRETDYVTGQAGLDLQKKTDGTVNILGEVATDEVAAWMIQTAQVASLFTLFTHHARTFSSLVHSLRNSLLKAGVFRDERIAERQVVDVIHFDIHLKHDMTGKRYIERITECIPCESESGQALFEQRDIIVYRDGRYEPARAMTESTVSSMKSEMTSADAGLFGRFIGCYWREKLGA
ncbi:pilus assembly protein CpaF [Paenibacillus sp. CAA11]|uniref:ATPase, T2SS/T4P/T4SS family n=1 Tax=Paenibacillus sp. CAA11 TaxID=1532905 RepID=UPI000D3455BE|nr:ATPase, T2SS/T4P/T4SS family [Paenibacillus sp. CAA11]AWB44858.1 pilus assembly protein CpaF [Paenibacillus sp. CAA11]